MMDKKFNSDLVGCTVKDGVCKIKEYLQLHPANFDIGLTFTCIDFAFDIPMKNDGRIEEVYVSKLDRISNHLIKRVINTIANSNDNLFLIIFEVEETVNTSPTFTNKKSFTDEDIDALVAEFTSDLLKQIGDACHKLAERALDMYR